MLGFYRNFWNFVSVAANRSLKKILRKIQKINRRFSKFFVILDGLQKRKKSLNTGIFVLYDIMSVTWKGRRV